MFDHSFYKFVTWYDYKANESKVEYMGKPTVLFITDLYYEAKNRQYYTEDIFVTSKLKDEFDVIICHPLHSLRFEKSVDMIVIRNSGPTIYYKQYFDDFFKRVTTEKILTYNSLDGRGDMLGKQYLITLTREGFPVIPTTDNLADIAVLPASEKYIIKPKEGADSIGMRIIYTGELQSIKLQNEITQPYIDFEYEVSFYFIDSIFQYALYARDKTQRWKLVMYLPSVEDLAFAEKFVQWNTMSHGIQRVDACRTKNRNLLLVELEDLNPFLSLDLLQAETRRQFIDSFKLSIKNVLAKS